MSYDYAVFRYVDSSFYIYWSQSYFAFKSAKLL